MKTSEKFTQEQLQHAANQTDLVEVMHTLKQVLCIKGN
jgi:hypothetical protein